jgi:butyrate kinase
MKYRVLSINPGSTSTKIAVYDDSREVFTKTLRHDAEELDRFGGIIEQYEFRKNLVLEAMQENNVPSESLEAVIGRGGLVRSVPGGTIRINDKMLSDLRNPELWGRIHASNLGAFISKSIGDELNIPSFIVDPVTVDEFHEVARISGVPEIERKSLFHALNIRYTARKLAKELEKNFAQCNMVAVHMGGGISVAAIEKGQVIDVNNAHLGMGPFSPQRAGALPIGDLLDLAYSGEYTKEELQAKLTKNSGYMGYLGTDSDMEVENMVKAGDEKYSLIYNALIYQLAKEIGGYATILKGQVDAIFLTGGLAYNQLTKQAIIDHCGYIAPIYVYPGENEMEALSQGGIRVLKGEEKAMEY